MKRSNIFWGLIFLCAAVLVILGQTGILPTIFTGHSVIKILLSILMLYWLSVSVPRLEYSGILFPIAFVCIIFAEPLHLQAITPWPVLAAALFGSIGLYILFPRHRFHHFHNHRKNWAASQNDVNSEFYHTEHVTGENVNCNASFASSTKYIDTEDFRQGFFKCSFGSLKVFFDNAKIPTGSAEIFVDNSFGETELYLPKEWYVDTQITVFAGEIKEIHRVTNEGTPAVKITGSVNFGECKIFYI